MKEVNSIFGLNPWRRSDWDQITEEFEKLRLIANAVTRMKGAGQCRVDLNENAIVVSVDDRFDTGTASVVTDWRISGLLFQTNERVIRADGLRFVGTADNWVTKHTGGTCAP
jgi:hypothetical protein